MAVDQLTVLPFLVRIPDDPDREKFSPLIFDTPSDLHMIVGFDPNILAPATIETFGRSLLVVAKEICQHSSSPRIGSLLEKIDMR